MSLENARLNRVASFESWDDPLWRACISKLDPEQGYNGRPFLEDRRLANRQVWQWGQLVYGLKLLDRINRETTVLSVGCGVEPIPFFLANHVRYVCATDYFKEKGLRGIVFSAFLSNPDLFAPFEYNRSRLYFAQMDGRSLGFSDSSFDVVYSLCVIEHFGGIKEAAQGLNEIARVLKPGGIAAITTEYCVNKIPLRSESCLCYTRQQLKQEFIQKTEMRLIQEIDFSTGPECFEKLTISSSKSKTFLQALLLKIAYQLLVPNGFTSLLTLYRVWAKNSLQRRLNKMGRGSTKLQQGVSCKVQNSFLTPVMLFFEKV